MLIMKYLCSVGPGRVNVVGAGRGNVLMLLLLQYYTTTYGTIKPSLTTIVSI